MTVKEQLVNIGTINKLWLHVANEQVELSALEQWTFRSNKEFIGALAHIWLHNEKTRGMGLYPETLAYHAKMYNIRTNEGKMYTDGRGLMNLVHASHRWYWKLLKEQQDCLMHKSNLTEKDRLGIQALADIYEEIVTDIESIYLDGDGIHLRWNR